MPISTVTTGQPVKASTMNAVIAQANKVPDVFTAGGNTVFTSQQSPSPTPGSTYVKVQEIRVPGGGVLRVVFNLRTENAAHTAYARVYRNGGAVGTERGTTSTTFASFSEDIGGWSAGDLLQIYMKSADATATVAAYLSGLSVRIGEAPIEFVESKL